MGGLRAPPYPLRWGRRKNRAAPTLWLGLGPCGCCPGRSTTRTAPALWLGLRPCGCCPGAVHNPDRPRAVAGVKALWLLSEGPAKPATPRLWLELRPCGAAAV